MRLLISALTALMLFATPVVAGDYEDARAAYKAGNYERAYRLIKPLAEQGDAEAQNTLGLMYGEGKGVPEDDAKAVYWYRKAAEQGHAIAQHNLASTYERGVGVPQDYVQAYAWYSLAAAQGDELAKVDKGFVEKKMTRSQVAEAQKFSGECVAKNYKGCDSTVTVQKPERSKPPPRSDPDKVIGDLEDAWAAYKAGDYQKAFRIFKPLAEQGDTWAQNFLGVMYAKSEGVPKDYAKAVHWYRKAAEQGNAKAQNNLGEMYDNGEGVHEDNAKAVQWYRKAAEQGDARAQYNLGEMYYEGEGVPKDYVQAYAWASIAVVQGHEDANHNLRGITKRLTIGQIIEGQELLSELWEKYVVPFQK